MLLRYQEYVIVISAEFTETFASGELQALLAETDTFMAEFLQGSRLSRGERPVPEAGLPASGNTRQDGRAVPGRESVRPAG